MGTTVSRFQERAREWEDSPLWYSQSAGGPWESLSWAEARRRVEGFGAGLIGLGLEPGDRVGLIGRNRPAWVAVDYGIQHAAGVTVPVYATSAPDQIAHVLGHSESRFSVVDNQEQLDKVLSIDLPGTERIIALHMGAEDDGRVIGVGRLLELGSDHLDALRARAEAVSPDDLFSIIYTSGTTGSPKGVALSHRNAVWTAEAVADRIGLRPSETLISYLPLSHVFERVVTTVLPLVADSRMVIHFLPDLTDLARALPEIRPTVFVAVPRVWQKFQARILAEAAEYPAGRQRMFHLATRAGEAAARRRQEGSSPVTRAMAGAARRVLARLILPKLGLDRCWYALSGAAPLSPELQRYFQGLGLPLHQGWGLTETTAAGTVQAPDDLEPGLVGAPLQGEEIRLGDDHEILVRGPNVFQGYFREPGMTVQSLRNGWLHTGDIGEIVPGGRLRIVDRGKDLIITSGGKNVAPSEIEQLIKATAAGLVADAMVVGDERPYLVALLALDPEESQAVSPEQVAQVMERVNARLSRAEEIKRWHVFPAGFPTETLTPSLKVRRKVLADRYAEEIEALYRRSQSPSGMGSNPSTRGR